MHRGAILLLLVFAAVEARKLILAIEEVEDDAGRDDDSKSSLMILYKSGDTSVNEQDFSKSSFLRKLKKPSHHGSGRLKERSGVHLNDEASLQSMWQDFKRKHSKSYETDIEDRTRFRIFYTNYLKIENHNREFEAGRKTYQMAMNHFGDLTHEEFHSQMKCFDITLANKSKSALGATRFLPPHNVKIPSEVDWRPQGYVTPVKNQGTCGSCYAFSATGSLEGQHFRKTGQLVSLSEQNLIDCSGRFGNQGCSGGLMTNAFKYIKQNGGIDTEDSYPYEAREGSCRYDPDYIGATVSGFTEIQPGNENDLEAAIASVGPVSVAIDANHDGFQFYRSGVYYEPACSSTQLDHGVLAVGYGDDGGQKFYIVKNSWGAGWGDSGYIRMARERDNNCGIASMASYPLV